MSEGSDENFRIALDKMVQLLSEEVTPSVRAFIGGIRSMEIARREHDQDGATVADLITGLVGLLSDFELRLRNLEKGKET